MNTIAQFYGIFFTMLSLGFILNKKNFENIVNDLRNHPAIELLMALLALLLGAFIVLQYPKPIGDIQAKLITIVGWLLFTVGFIRTVAPAVMQKILNKCAGKCAPMMGAAVLMFLLGVSLLYFGFDMHQLLK